MQEAEDLRLSYLIIYILTKITLSNDMAISLSPGHLSPNISRYLQINFNEFKFWRCNKEEVFEALFAQSMSQIILKLYSVFIAYKYWISKIF